MTIWPLGRPRKVSLLAYVIVAVIAATVHVSVRSRQDEQPAVKRLDQTDVAQASQALLFNPFDVAPQAGARGSAAAGQAGEQPSRATRVDEGSSPFQSGRVQPAGTEAPAAETEAAETSVAPAVGQAVATEAVPLLLASAAAPAAPAEGPAGTGKKGLPGPGKAGPVGAVKAGANWGRMALIGGGIVGASAAVGVVVAGTTSSSSETIYRSPATPAP